LVFLLSCWLPSQAQVNIGATGAAKENFNAMGNGTALPAHWKMSAAGQGAAANWSTGSNVTTLTGAAHSGTPSVGGRYNWGTAEGTDRAVGFMSDGSYGSPNAILVRYQNETGAAVSSFTVAFQVERYHINTSPFTLSFFSSTNDVTYTARSEGDVSGVVFAGGASGYTFATPRTVYKTVTITESIPVDGSIYLRWVFTSTGAGSQGLGLDNVTVSLNSTTPAVSATLEDALTTDANNNGKANEGDKLTYTTTISSTGKDATGVQYNAPLDANTALSGAVRTSAIAVDESFATPFNTQLTGQNVLANDFGLPATTVVSFGTTESGSGHLAGSAGTSDNGGTLTVNANGSFTYAPPAGFTGYDRFSYAVRAGVTPDDVGTVTIAVGNAPSAGAAEEFPGVIGNVIVNNAPSLLSNDAGDGLKVCAVNDNAALVGAATTASPGGGKLTVNEDGIFAYNPAPGYTGPVQFSYTIDNGFSAPQKVTVHLTVSGMIWFVNNTASAGGDGRLSAPFNSLAGVSNGAGGSAVNQTIFVYSGSGNYTGGITLLNNQKLIGQGASASLASLAGVTVPTYSPSLPATGSTAPVLTASAAVITLADGNTVRGLSTTGGTNSVLGATKTGATIQENTFNGASAEGIYLPAHAGNALISGNTVSAALTAVRVGTAASGTLNIALNNNTITSTSGTGALLDGTGGSLTTITGFSGNTVSGFSGGTGISVANARFDAVPGGAYDIVAGGTTAIGASGNPVGAGGLALTGITGDLVFDDLDIYATGSIGGLTVSSSGTYSAAGTGFRIIVSPYVSTIAVNGGPGADITNATISLPLAAYTSTGSPTSGLSLVNTAGTFSTSTNGQISGITSAAGTAVHINGGNSTVSIGIPVTVTQGKGIDIASRSGSTVAFTGALSLSTGANPGFSAANGGTITVTGATTNTISTTTGTALNVSNTTIGAGGLTFRSISANGAANGIVLNNTGSTAGLTVTGNGSAGTGGTIQNTTGDGITLTTTRNISFDRMNIQNTGGNGVYGTGVVNFTFTNGTINNSGTSEGVNQSNINFGKSVTFQENNVSGIVNITQNTFSNPHYHGVDIFNWAGLLDYANVSNNTISAKTGSVKSQGSAIRLIARGASVTSASVTRANLDNNTVQNGWLSVGIQAQGDIQAQVLLLPLVPPAMLQTSYRFLAIHLLQLRQNQ
jgi:hypothetical protein